MSHSYRCTVCHVPCADYCESHPTAAMVAVAASDPSPQRLPRWAVYCDGERTYHPTRDAARAEARAVNRHPSKTNIRAFGPYRNVDGIARVIDTRGPS